MSTTLAEPAVDASFRPAVMAAERLRTRSAAVRLSFSWLGTRKSLDASQKAEAAQAFGAEGEYLSAGKKLLDTGHPAFKAVTAVKYRAVSYLKAISLPFPEPGIRLIRQDQVDGFQLQMEAFAADLEAAVSELECHYGELRTAARERLGRLYNPDDYPDSLAGLFRMSWDFPSCEPPEYLLRLNPQVYEQECERVRRRFDDAVRLAEEAFQEELSQLVQHLVERLSGQTDAKPKIFRDSAVTNLTEFFDRFRQLNVRSNEQLDALVDQCRQIVRGVEPQALRDSTSLRQSVARELGQVKQVLDEVLVDRPRRNILRRPR